MTEIRLTRELLNTDKTLYVLNEGQYRKITSLRWQAHGDRFIATVEGASLKVIELREGTTLYVQGHEHYPLRHSPTKRPMPEGWGVVH